MSTSNGNDTDVKAMQAELRELRARVRTLEAEKRRPTLEGHGARVQAIAAEAAALQPLKEAAAATAPAKAAALALGPSVRLEYTRDSPMFRRQCEGFENSLAGLDSLLGGLAIRLRDWSAALRASRDAARECAAWLKDRRHARALFGGREALGDSSARCATLADALADDSAFRAARMATSGVWVMPTAEAAGGRDSRIGRRSPLALDASTARRSWAIVKDSSALPLLPNGGGLTVGSGGRAPRGRAAR